MLATLHAALDSGINFFDTADVYGDGRSERLIARLRRERSEPFFVATKAGRRLPEQTVAGYSAANVLAFVDRSLENLAVERIDLLQLHCPPTEVYYRPEVFGFLDDLVAAGKLRHYGVSVEKVEEALKAIEYPHVQSASAILDRFLHHAEIISFQGRSYRLRNRLTDGSAGDPTPAAGSKPASAPTGNRRAKPTTSAADATDQTVTN